MHRIVLAALLAPLVGLGIVLWYFLPGGSGGVSYRPGEFSRSVQFSPQDWHNRTVSIRGYLVPVPYLHTLVLTDSHSNASMPAFRRQLAHSVVLRLQGESGWHAFLRRLLPQMLAAPFPAGHHAGDLVTVTGKLASAPMPNQPPVLIPSGL